MLESEYWSALEYRLCREFQGLPDKHLRYLWCDGLLPTEYLLAGPSPRIKGRAWICQGHQQDEWDVTLFLNRPVESPSQIDWSSLLPPENVTRWLAVDLPSKRIEMQPSGAVPDTIPTRTNN